MRIQKLNFSILHVLSIRPVSKSQMRLKGSVDTSMGAVIHVQRFCDPTRDCRTSYGTSRHPYGARRSVSRSLHGPVRAQDLPGNSKDFPNCTGRYGLRTDYCTGPFVHVAVALRGPRGQNRKRTWLEGKQICLPVTEILRAYAQPFIVRVRSASVRIRTNYLVDHPPRRFGVRRP